MNQTPAIPPAVFDAATAMLKPFGVDFKALIEAQDAAPAPQIATLAGPKYLNTNDAIRYTGLGRWTLWRAQKAGEIAVSKLHSSRSGKLLYDRESLDRWLQGKRKPAASESMEG